MDDRLRLLERAARVDQGDVLAGRALARALDQTGDVVGAWRARCRLARAGDPDVWRELNGRPASVRAPREVTALELAGRPEVLDGSDHGLLLTDGDAVAVWDPVALTPRWSAPRGDRAIALVGPVAVLASQDRRTLALRRSTDGEPIAEVALPFECWWRLESTAGYALVWAMRTGSGPNRIATVDLVDTPEQVLGARNESKAFTMRLARGLRLVAGERRMVFRRVFDGRLRGRCDGRLVASDDEQVFTVEGEVPGDAWFVDATRLADGETWRRPIDGRRCAALTDSTLVLAREPDDWPAHERRTAEELDLLALDRRTGEPRWHLRDAVGPHHLVDLAAARDVVVVAYGPPVRPTILGGWQLVDLTLRGLDASSGETLWVRELGPARRTGRRGLCLVDRAVLMIVDPGRRLIRVSG